MQKNKSNEKVIEVQEVFKMRSHWKKGKRVEEKIKREQNRLLIDKQRYREV